jgi:hypothetical protein
VAQEVAAFSLEKMQADREEMMETKEWHYMEMHSMSGMG